ncbi:single-stranded DNA-binding protein [Mycoplasmopsis glycophila]|uniref:Single-stranded DNA-binding protein n=1 Tax=Mycoplasmopsis glycophila TaxID=171285 RepID=A0A449AV82_9BACT|nr:single-stranded DNA-binding protein [Mycoplasmopsis glycophila]VEU70405.1 single strand binding protein [Mycoplasmopsis glycophila]
MINSVILVGRLTATPTLATTSNGISYVRFSLAINRRGNSDVTDFINLVAWRNTADYISKYATKGALVAVEGELHSNTYTSATTNSTVRSFDVLVNNFRLLESRQASQNRNANYSNHNSENFATKGFTPNFQNHANQTSEIDFSSVRTSNSSTISSPILDDEVNPVATHDVDSLFDMDFSGAKIPDED